MSSSVREGAAATGIVVGVIVAIVVLAIAGTFVDLGMKAYFQPKYVQVENKVFQQSQQHVDGMNQELENLNIQYNTCEKGSAGDGCRSVIKATVLHDFAAFPVDQLTPQNQSFYTQMQGATP